MDVSNPFRSELLDYELNFTYTEKATAKKLSALLEQGDYRAIEKRAYDCLQRCHGCGVAEKAKTLVVVENRLTGEQFEIGLVCMNDLYGVDTDRLNEHAKAVARARRETAQKLGLTGDLSLGRMIEIAREAVVMYIPIPGRFTALLDNMDDITLSNSDSEQLRDLYMLALYHREWQEDAPRAETRWKGLAEHPAFRHGPVERTVRALCQRALGEQRQLTEQPIHRLNHFLRQAAAHPVRKRRLVLPEDFADRTSYKEALHRALLNRLQSGVADTRLSGSADISTRNLLKDAGPDAPAFYTTAAVWQDDAERLSARVRGMREYHQRGLDVLVVVGAEQIEEVPAVIRSVRNRDNELEDREFQPAWTFRYRLVAWTVVEDYTPTFALWKQYGRASMEQYL